ncbi:hypothetical protein [Candidatus Enterovibrio escicola]|uniref:Uncharacterized protein n=1 Tax=Candidatus Enterovibrio escicola TaxID=1927127 RepID=A0A2A5T2W1_9GAMM|nr:hypothetical protein [Candidatus Enterovibrio escacola]PCS22484.1 hypothetical protein BTN49_1892 [Candidatus Enterovibrio escacola]
MRSEKLQICQICISKLLCRSEVNDNAQISEALANMKAINKVIKLGMHGLPEEVVIDQIGSNTMIADIDLWQRPKKSQMEEAGNIPV